KLIGLPFDTLDPLGRMAYPGGRRPTLQTLLAATQRADSSWDVVALPGFEQLQEDEGQVDVKGEWRAMMRELLARGTFRHDDRSPEHARVWEALRARFGA